MEDTIFNFDQAWCAVGFYEKMENFPYYFVIELKIRAFLTKIPIQVEHEENMIFSLTFSKISFHPEHVHALLFCMHHANKAASRDENLIST